MENPHLDYGHGWFASPQGDDKYHIVAAFDQDMDSGIIVARVSGGSGQFHVTDKQADYHAKLFAAAPDVFRELKALIDVIQSHEDPKTGEVRIPGGALSLFLPQKAVAMVEGEAVDGNAAS